MRVLLVHGWHPVEGGTEMYAGWIRDALAGAGDEVRLLTGTAGSAAGGTADYLARATTGRAAQAILQIENPWAAAAARRAVRDFRPDVVLALVFANFLSPAVFRPFREVPVVLSVTDYKIVCPVATKLLPDGSLCARPHGAVCLTEGCTGPLHWLRDRLRYRLIADAVAGADVVLALSERLRETLGAAGVEARRLEWPVAPVPEGARRRPAPEPRFLYAGRLSREKGVMELVDAFGRVAAAYPDARLVLAGSGPLEDELRGRVDAVGLGPRVTFRGWLPASALEEEYARAWALVAPSLWAEPLGLVAVEAIARGLPVVASETGGFRETVRPGAGRLVPNGDVSALAGALEAVASGAAFPDRSVPDELRREARQRHDLDAHVRALRTVLAEAAGLRPAAIAPEA